MEQQQESALVLANDALDYAEKMLEIFARSVGGQYARHEDYAIHRNRQPWDEVPQYWMSTPMVPLCIGSIFGTAVEKATELERPLVTKIGEHICVDFEKLIRMAEGINGYTNSLSTAASNATHILPQLKAMLK